MNTLRNNWKVIGFGVLFILVNLIILGRTRLAYGAFQWMNYADAYVLPGERLAPVTKIGGSIEAIATNGDYAYISQGSELVVIDATDRDHPVEIGRSHSFPSVITEVAAVEGRAVVAVKEEGIWTLDISNPAQIRELGRYSMGGAVEGLVLDGDLVLLAMGEEGLKLLDIADPTKPVLKGSVDTPGKAVELAINGRFAYIADLEGGLVIVDVSNPASPAIIGGFTQVPNYASVNTIATANNAESLLAENQPESISYQLSVHDVAVSGNYAYLASNYDLLVIDVSLPDSPVDITTAMLTPQVQQLEFSGGYLYVITYSAIEFYSTNDGSELSLLAHLDIPDESDRVALMKGESPDQDLLFLANPYGDITIISPGKMGWGVQADWWTVYDSALSGDYIYLIGTTSPVIWETELFQINVSNPQEISTMRVVENLESPWSIELSGNYAYVTDLSGNLHVIELSDPQNSTIVETFHVFDPAGIAPMYISITEDRAYISGAGQIYVMDLADPIHPTLLGTLQWDSGWGGTTGMHFLGQYALVMNPSDGLHIFNIENLANAVEVAHIPATYSDPWSTPPFTLIGNYLYIVTTTSKTGEVSYGLTMYDLSDPTNPAQVGFFPLKEAVDELVARNDRLFLFSPTGKILILDAISPISLKEINFFQDFENYLYLPGKEGLVYGIGRGTFTIFDLIERTDARIVDTFYWSLADPFEVVASGSRLFVADKRASLVEINLGNPLSPEITPLRQPGDGSYNPYTHQGRSITLSKGLAFIGHEYNSFSIFDISEPEKMEEVGYYYSDGDPKDIKVSGDKAALALGDDGIEIVSITDPSQPELLGSLELGGFASGIDIQGNYVYVANRSEGLQIINITDPVHPSLVATYKGIPSMEAEDVLVQDQLAYLAGGPAGLIILDISNPANVVQIGVSDTIGWAEAIALSGNNALIADGISGLVVIDIQDPSQPVQVASYDTAGYAEGVAADDQFIYLADHKGGLYVFTLPVHTRLQPDKPATLVSPDQNIKIEFPSGAITSTATLTIFPQLAPSSPTGVFAFAGVTFEVTALTANGEEIHVFEKPFTLTLVYSDEDIAGLDEKALKLFLYYEEDGRWIDAATTCKPASTYKRNLEDNELSVDICHLTEFALVESISRLRLPFITGLQTSPVE